MGVGGIFRQVHGHGHVLTPTVSYFTWLMPGPLFFLALVLPNLDMRYKHLGHLSADAFYNPLLKSAAYFLLTAAGMYVCFMLFFIAPFFLYVAIIPAGALLYLYFLKMAKLAIRFLGREQNLYGENANYHIYALSGIAAVVVTFLVPLLLPDSISRSLSSELSLLIGGMAGLGYMLGRTLQQQYDEEQFYLENYTSSDSQTSL
ncbi:hypothetical protein CA264_06900 [Pontibacter actiniarum]|uniref:Uncharacterized protein n=2 Tax=Pontibacter actiniarum TaxID=323450 RepID=A0A1X9YQP3_9BACT|nr:hypothetical protein CA264_06900 [Pontibacter actiniarum]